jgi:hypothetical protein
MNILLVEPKKSQKYHTQYPPLGLLKLAAYHKNRGDQVNLVKGFDTNGFIPDKIYITSLFTYAWEPVHEVINYYLKKYRKAEITVGGIYASLCEEHLKDTFKDKIAIYKGIFDEAEDVLPDYSLVPSWKASIVFASRGCIRKCAFCSVNQLEPIFKPKKSIKHLIYPGHKKIIFWDNNILASPYWKDIFSELEELNLEVDINQGLDARLINQEVASALRKLKLPIIRLAYDSSSIRPYLKKAIELLAENRVDKRSIIVYCLYNYSDSPEDFLNRIQDLLEWGVVSYPMRYEPIEPRLKSTYVSPNWTAEQLEMVAKARRVLGYGGAFPPYEGLKKKILGASSFEKAFELRPPAPKIRNSSLSL